MEQKKKRGRPSKRPELPKEIRENIVEANLPEEVIKAIVEVVVPKREEEEVVPKKIIGNCPVTGKPVFG